MRVVINGRFIDQPLTGVQRFGREMVRAIADLAEEQHPLTNGMEFMVARPRSNEPIYEPRLPETRVGRFRGHLWEQTSLPRFARGAVLLNFCNMAPLAAGRSILCVHDAHVWHIPENYRRAFRWWYQVVQPLALRRSQRWTSVSRYSAEAILACRAAPRPADAITYGSGNSVLTADPSEESTVDINALPRPYVFALASASANKNLALVAGIAPELKRHGVATLVAGGSSAHIFGRGSHGGADLVRLGRVSDADLADLYRHALAFLFPSFEEGFGAPPLEAMALGCPVIASNTSALPEVLGDAAALLSPTDRHAWSEAVLKILTDEEARNTLVRLGTARAARYQWRDTALQFLELARQVGAGRRVPRS